MVWTLNNNAQTDLLMYLQKTDPRLHDALSFSTKPEVCALNMPCFVSILLLYNIGPHAPKSGNTLAPVHLLWLSLILVVCTFSFVPISPTRLFPCLIHSSWMYLMLYLQWWICIINIFFFLIFSLQKRCMWRMWSVGCYPSWRDANTEHLEQDGIY